MALPYFLVKSVAPAKYLGIIIDSSPLCSSKAHAKIQEASRFFLRPIRIHVAYSCKIFNDDKENAGKQWRSEGLPGSNPPGLFLFIQGCVYSSGLKCQDLSDKLWIRDSFRQEFTAGSFMPLDQIANLGCLSNQSGENH